MDEDRPDTAMYFTTAQAFRGSLVVGGHLCVEETEPSVTRVSLLRDGSWFSLFDIPEVVYAVALVPSPATLVFVGRRGHVRENAAGEVPTDHAVDVPCGYLLDARWIGNHVYACGTQRQVHKRTATGVWTRIDDGVFSPLKNQVDRSFLSISGFADDDLYAVGSGPGQLWHYDGAQWSAVATFPSGFEVYTFTKVFCASTGDLYVAGAGKLFLLPRGGAWRTHDSVEASVVIDDLAEFDGRIYATARDRLYVVNGDALVFMPVSAPEPTTFYRLAVDGDAMWGVGDESVARFSGGVWTCFPNPNNRRTK